MYARAEMACVRGRLRLLSMGAWCASDQDDRTGTRGMMRFTFRKDRKRARRVRAMDKLKGLDCRRGRGTSEEHRPMDACSVRGVRHRIDAHVDPRVMRVQWQAQRHFGNRFVRDSSCWFNTADFVCRGFGLTRQGTTICEGVEVRGL